MTGIVIFIVYVTHLTHLESIDGNRRRHCKSVYIGIGHIIIVGGLEHVDAFKVIDAEEKHQQRNKHRHSYYQLS